MLGNGMFHGDAGQPGPHELDIQLGPISHTEHPEVVTHGISDRGPVPLGADHPARNEPARKHERFLPERLIDPRARNPQQLIGLAGRLPGTVNTRPVHPVDSQRVAGENIQHADARINPGNDSGRSLSGPLIGATLRRGVEPRARDDPDAK